MTKPQRALILAKTNGHCAYCGIQLTGKWQADHMHPIRRTKRWVASEVATQKKIIEDILIYPERDTFDNLWPSCQSCNNYKNGNPLEVFRKMVGKQIEILRRDRPTFRLAERYGLIECKPVDRVVFYFENLSVDSCQV